MSADYYGVIGNRDYIKLQGEKRPFWEFLDRQPDGWLTSLAYQRDDLPTGKRMIFDCGAWSYKDEQEPRLGKNLVTPVWALEKYQSKASVGDFVIAPDHMLIPDVDIEARRNFNTQSAEEFIGLVENTGFIPMATIHGMNLIERIATAKHYSSMGYTALALGGMAARASQKSLLISMVAEIRQSIPDVWLHVLGLSSPEYAAAWSELGVNSFDGSSHFKQAFTAGAFFARKGAKLVKHQAARPGETLPDDMPLCDCRACSLLREDGIDTRTYGSNENNMGRAAHNMNILMQAQQVAIYGSVYLISCVGEKLPKASQASELYQSTWFKKARGYVEQTEDDWYVISAKYGLVHNQEVVEPYEKTLNTMKVDERKAWASEAFSHILKRIPKGEVVIMAGQNYREFLTPLLIDAGYVVSTPLEGLGIGQQLAWFDANTKKEFTQKELF